MEEGEKCICQEDEWFNAFGESNFSVTRGMRLTVKSSIYVGGSQFFSFEETPDSTYYMGIGFAPLRHFN